MKPPSSVRIGPHNYSVIADVTAILKISAEDNERKLGTCDTRMCVINVDPEQADSQLRDTVLHEVLHACFDLIGAGEDISDDTEEKLVRRLSPVLMDVINKNPRLMTWLTE